MILFDMGNQVKDIVINEILEAEEYIRIAMFQMHDKALFDQLKYRLNQSIALEIFTLPYDSINESIRERVSKQFEELKNAGAKIYFNAWNIGDPERTSTAVGRWYSFHGKFIVTEKSAIALSANFTDYEEIDAVLIYKKEPEIIREFNEKFSQLLKLFYTPHSGKEGNIHELISTSSYKYTQNLFILPKVIESNKHINNWITDYPSELCPEKNTKEFGLFVCPFDIRARTLITNIINQSDSFLFISTESFTDPFIPIEIIKASSRGVEVKILAGDKSMDFSERMKKIYFNLLANGVKLKTTEENLHSKLIITEKLIAVSSINLIKMNLGFTNKTDTWRANTESITIVRDIEIVEDAKNKFLMIFNKGITIEQSLATKIEKEITTFFTKQYQLRSKGEVKKLFSKFLINEQINLEKKMITIGRVCSLLVKRKNKSLISRDEFLIAIILFLLSENKLRADQLELKLSIFEEKISVSNYIYQMTLDNLIEEENGYYKIKVISLFEGI